VVANRTHRGDGADLACLDGCGTTERMNTRRIVSSSVLVVVCALAVILGVARAGGGPVPVVPTQPVETQLPVEAQPLALQGIIEQAKLIPPTLDPQALPPGPVLPGWACPGTENIQNLHVRVGSPVRSEAAADPGLQQELIGKMLATIATIPPPPCP